MSVYRWELDKALPHEYELSSILKALGANPRQRREAFDLREAQRRPSPLPVEPQQDQFSLHRGGLLRSLRGRRGWSCAKVANAIGVRVSLLRDWESMHCWPDDSQLHLLAFTLGASETELIALSNGISAFESLSPPDFSEMLNRMVNLYYAPGAVENIEPVIFSLAHRAKHFSEDLLESEDFMPILSILYASILFRDGRSVEARWQLRHLERMNLVFSKPGTRLAHMQITGFLARGHTSPASPVARREIARNLERSVNEVATLEDKVSTGWQAAMANERAFALFYAGDIERAIRESDHSLQIASRGNYSDLLVRLTARGRLLCEMNRHQQVLDELTPHVNQNPETDSFLYLYIGKAHQALGDAFAAHTHLMAAQTIAKSIYRPERARRAEIALSKLEI